jgi:hypothetical protein
MSSSTRHRNEAGRGKFIGRPRAQAVVSQFEKIRRLTFARAAPISLLCLAKSRSAIVTHPVDGFDLTFTSRRSWKAHRREHGRLVDVVPVTWTKGRHASDATKEIFQEVWYQDRDELAARAADVSPFVVALATAKDYGTFPHAFKEFVGVFEVVATGKMLSDISIETKVLRRVRAQ